MLYNLSIQLNSVSNLRHGLQVTRLDAAPMWPLNWCAAIWQTTWFVQLIENYHLSNYYWNNITLYTWLGMLFFVAIFFNRPISQLSIWRAKSSENSCQSSVEVSRTEWITDLSTYNYSKRPSFMEIFWRIILQGI